MPPPKPPSKGGAGRRSPAERFDESLAELQARTDAIKSETAALSENRREQTRLQAVQDLLNDARRDGIEIGQRFATAQDLINASAEELTPTLAKQRDAILAGADAYAKAATAADLAAQKQRNIADLESDIADLGLSSLRGLIDGQGLE
jgi:hypothetical protein